MDIAMLASEEKDVDESIIRASGMRELKVKETVAIKKLWRLCRAAADATCALSATAHMSHMVMPPLGHEAAFQSALPSAPAPSSGYQVPMSWLQEKNAFV